MDEAPPAPPDVNLSSLVESVLILSVLDFDAATRELQSAAQAVCADSSANKVDSARDAWRAAAATWNRLIYYYYGPLDDDPFVPTVFFIESYRQRGIAYAEAVRTSRETLVGGNGELTPEVFEALRFNQVGLLGLEISLFEAMANPETASSEALAIELAQTPRQCEHLVGLATLLELRADRVRRGWQESFPPEQVPFASTFESGSLSDGSSSLASVLAGVFRQLEYVRSRKLEGPMDAEASGYFYPQVASGISEVRSLVNGKGDFLGIAAALREANAGVVADRLEIEISAVEAAIQAEASSRLAVALRALEQSFRTSVPEGLGVQLGLNFSDGD